MRRGAAAVASGALVVGAGASVGALSAHMSAGWTEQAALDSAAQVVADPVVPKPVVVTRIKKRHVTPDPVIIHKQVIVHVPAGQGGQAQAPVSTSSGSTSSTSQVTSQPSRTTSTRTQPSRTVVAPAPAPPKTSGGSSAGTTSKTS